MAISSSNDNFIGETQGVFIYNNSMPAKAGTYLLIDLENVPHFDPSGIARFSRVLIFVGPKQSKIDFELVAITHDLGNKVKWIKVEESGKNALDMCIAFHLGEICKKEESAKYYVLSKDKGYEPLVKHLHALGIDSCRVDSIENIEKGSPDKIIGKTESIDDAVEHFLAMNKANRPKSRKSLEKVIASNSSKFADQEVEETIRKLIASKRLKIGGDGKIDYLSEA